MATGEFLPGEEKGEAIVLGKVTPDRFVLDKKDRKMVERVISKKDTVIATLAQDGQGQTGPRDQASLTDAQLDELAQLGLRVEAYFKYPCDIEWAVSQGKFYLLQSRAIKGAQDATSGDEREKVRQEEIATLRARAAPGGTVFLLDEPSVSAKKLRSAVTDIVYSFIRYRLKPRTTRRPSSPSSTSATGVSPDIAR